MLCLSLLPRRLPRPDRLQQRAGERRANERADSVDISKPIEYPPIAARLEVRMQIIVLELPTALERVRALDLAGVRPDQGGDCKGQRLGLAFYPDAALLDCIQPAFERRQVLRDHS